MRAIAIFVALVAITSVAVAQNAAAPAEPKMIQLIQLKYIDVGTVMRLFGGNVIPTSGYNSRPSGPRGGYSNARTGSQVGGSYTTPRTYYRPQNNYGYSDQNGNIQLPTPTPNTGQQYDAF